MARLAEAAAAGELPWLDAVLHEAGYIRADEGLRQSDLVAAVPGLTRSTIRNWERDGLPVVRERRRAVLYPALGMIRWLVERFVRPGRPRSRSAEKEAWDAHDAEFKAKLRELEWQRERGEVVSKAEHEAAMIGMALQVRAALLAQAGRLAPQLAEQPIAVVREVLDRQNKWLCREMAKGRVPIPQEAVADVEAAIAKHLDDGSSAAKGKGKRGSQA